MYIIINKKDVFIRFIANYVQLMHVDNFKLITCTCIASIISTLTSARQQVNLKSTAVLMQSRVVSWRDTIIKNLLFMNYLRTFIKVQQATRRMHFY